MSRILMNYYAKFRKHIYNLIARDLAPFTRFVERQIGRAHV